MKLQIPLMALMALPLSVFAADVTGTWKADFETQRGTQKYTFTLKQDGTNVTGKASVDNSGEKTRIHSERWLDRGRHSEILRTLEHSRQRNASDLHWQGDG